MTKRAKNIFINIVSAPVHNLYRNQLSRSRATGYEFMFKKYFTKQSFEEYIL